MDSYPSLLNLIGNTPLVQLPLNVPPTVLGKMEYLNPGGSLKDRSALYMIEEAERKGHLTRGGTIVEASSGNQGIALAMIGAIKGYKVIITVPERTSAEKVETLRAYGAETLVCKDTDELEDPEGYHSVAERIFEELRAENRPCFMPNQYFNPSNPQAHYRSTGPEVWEQTSGQVTHFVCGTGSCGTVTGVARYLKEKNENIQVIGVDSMHSAFSSSAPESYNVEGIGIDVVSDTLDLSVIDKIIPISDEDAFQMTRTMAKQGILVGISSGAVIHVAETLAQSLSPDDLVVTILGDSGRAYLSKVFGVSS